MTAALLASVVRTSPRPANALYALFAAPLRPIADEYDADRECGCGWREYFEIDHAALVVIESRCSGRDCEGLWAQSERRGLRHSTHDVLALLNACCICEFCR